MEKSYYDKFAENPENQRLLNQENLILDVTEAICETMEKEGISRTELARRLKLTKGYITQLLGGRTNMTLRKVADVFTALNRQVHIVDSPMSTSYIYTFSTDVQPARIVGNNNDIKVSELVLLEHGDGYNAGKYSSDMLAG